MIVYSPFWETLQEKGVSTYSLIHKFGVSSSTVSRIRNNQGVNTNTIDDLCRILDCKVEDIIEYKP